MNDKNTSTALQHTIAPIQKKQHSTLRKMLYISSINRQFIYKSALRKLLYSSWINHQSIYIKRLSGIHDSC